MQDVDAFARMHCYAVDEESNSIFENAIYVNQIRDPNVVRIKTELENRESKFYEVKDNLLFRKYKDRLLLYVPVSMEQSVIYKYHNSLGYFGVDKVCELIKRSYWLPQMQPKLKDHISKCIACISFNLKLKKFDGPLFYVDKIAIPFQTIHADHLGPLTLTKGKNEHILAIVDGFTKFLKLYATKTTNSREVMKHLKSYFIVYSTPEVLVTDRGTAFTSKQFA